VDSHNRRMAIMSIEAITKVDNLKSWSSGLDVDRETVSQLRNVAQFADPLGSRRSDAGCSTR
jgi:hypothetical protein